MDTLLQQSRLDRLSSRLGQTQIIGLTTHVIGMTRNADAVFGIRSENTTDMGELLDSCGHKVCTARSKFQTVPSQADQEVALTITLGLDAGMKEES